MAIHGYLFKKKPKRPFHYSGRVYFEPGLPKQCEMLWGENVSLSRYTKQRDWQPSKASLKFNIIQVQLDTEIHPSAKGGRCRGLYPRLHCERIVHSWVVINNIWLNNIRFQTRSILNRVDSLVCITICANVWPALNKTNQYSAVLKIFMMIVSVWAIRMFVNIPRYHGSSDRQVIASALPSNYFQFTSRSIILNILWLSFWQIEKCDKSKYHNMTFT